MSDSNHTCNLADCPICCPAFPTVQEKDRVELRGLLQRFNAPNIIDSPLEQRLLFWKYGRQYWCAHMLQIKVYNKERGDGRLVWRRFVLGEGWSFYNGDEFKFCPDCGTEKPE
jgi:hypothetical protein